MAIADPTMKSAQNDPSEIVSTEGEMSSTEDQSNMLKMNGTAPTSSAKRVLSVKDIVGGNTSRPTEMEMETRILKASEDIDLSTTEDDPETTKLMSDIAAGEIAKAQLSKRSASVRSSQSRASTVDNVDYKVKVPANKNRDRLVSIDEQLFGLTAALADMDGRSTKRQQKESMFATSTSSVEGVAGPTTSERLAKTAQVLVGPTHEKIRQQKIEKAKSQRHLNVADIESQSTSSFGREDGEEGAAKSSKNSKDESESEFSKKMHRYGDGRKLAHHVKDEMDMHWNLFQEFIESRKATARKYLRNLFLFCILPCLALAFLFYYALGNPHFAAADDHDKSNNASVSWMILFVFVRQPLTFTLAVLTQALIIDFIVFRTQAFVKLSSPLVTLWLVQSKGWPFICTFWGIYNSALLMGDRQLSKHWLYFQDWIDLFNDKNPSGIITYSRFNQAFVRSLIFVGLAMSVKRVLVSLFLGRNTFAHFGEQLASNMKHMVLIGKISGLAKRIERLHERIEKKKQYRPSSLMAIDEEETDNLQDIVTRAHVNVAGSDDGMNEVNASPVMAANAFIQNRTTISVAPTKTKKVTSHEAVGRDGASADRKSAETEHGDIYNDRSDDEDFNSNDNYRGMPTNSELFSKSAKMKMAELLDAWEEPEPADEEKVEKKITLGSILQFRQALTLMNAKYPFSPDFGMADTRAACIESAQALYRRLMLRTPGKEELPFETLALIAKDGSSSIGGSLRGHDDNGFDDDTIKDLIRIFRPDRDGKLNEFNFVKSIDTIYKSVRLLSANIRNNRHTDAAVESIVNGVFWFITGASVLGAIGVDPIKLLVSLSTLFVSFAFMFGGSAAKYFEGMLFILLQRPYGVGDRVHLSNPSTDTNIDGSSGWIVEKLTLHTTTMYWGATNERCTIANGAISNLRVINAARSPHAQIYVNMMLAIDTPYDTIEVFRAAVEQFLKDRPREWLAFGGFRPTMVAVDRGYINYMIIAQHRSSWQDLGSILASKADLVKFCMEVAKQLDMRYSSPPLPVSLTIGNAEQVGEITPKETASLFKK